MKKVLESGAKKLKEKGKQARKLWTRVVISGVL